MTKFKFSEIKISEKFVKNHITFTKISDEYAASIPGLTTEKFDKDTEVEVDNIPLRLLKEFKNFTYNRQRFKKIPKIGSLNALREDGNMYVLNEDQIVVEEKVE